MLTSTRAFLEPLEKWIQAIHANDFVTAKHTAQHLIRAGELLAIHPEFQRCFKTQCDGVDPRQALVYTCQFLMCATEGRARAMEAAAHDSPTRGKPDRTQ